MSQKLLHIVSFDNPYPPNYGGVIDVYYKVKAFHEIGYAVHLHCFVKEIPLEFEELKAISTQVYFYKIRQNPFFLMSSLPFSVISRSDRALGENIAKIKAPILFEGLKTTCLSNDLRIKDHKKILRLQNIEEDYFNGISKSETSLFKKLLFKIEALKYKKYKDVFLQMDQVVTLSISENELVRPYAENAVYVPVFHGNTQVAHLEGFGSYSIYHGDLSTADNLRCVAFLIDVFAKMPTQKLVIAGGSNENYVRDLIGKKDNIEFVRLKDFEHLKQLLQNSHISISWSFQKSGTKLKAVNSLFNTRFCLINENIIDDPAIADLCVLASDEKELILQIEKLSQESFTDFPRRKAVLENRLNDKLNALQIAKLIQDE